MDELWRVLARPLPPWRRALDLALSSTFLVVLSPLLGAIALAVKLDSPGPVIFRQTRVGLGGRTFTLYKFRSMRADAEALREELEELNEMDGPVFKIRDDPRLTRVGRFLRPRSLDELPQFWNVLRGDMTLVGPRPPLPRELPGYARWQLRRLSHTVGLTCIWQVNGRNDVGFEEWMRMDLRYLRSRSLWLDLKLIASTAWTLVTGRGAY